MTFERLINQDVVQELGKILQEIVTKKFLSSTLNRLSVLSYDKELFTTKSLILAQDER